MIHGDRDLIPKFEKLTDFVPNAEVVSLDAGHWILQEMPEETNQVILKWLKNTISQRLKIVPSKMLG
jgi:pimeloyl-ACP methyl ester carboxylesterase